MRPLREGGDTMEREPYVDVSLSPEEAKLCYAALLIWATQTQYISPERGQLMQRLCADLPRWVQRMMQDQKG